MKKGGNSWLLASVVALHAGVIALLIWAPSPHTEELTLPSIQGILLPAPPAEAVQTPAVAEIPAPVEPPPELEKPKPKKLKPAPKPKPLPKAAPSEKAISQPEPKQNPVPPPPQQVSTPTAEHNKTLGAPVTPPREDANSLNNPAPAYPRMSRKLHESGIVLLEILILPDGTVGEIRVKESSGFKRLDETAVRAVKRWTYIPAHRGDKAIAYWYQQPVEFSLN